MEKNSLIIRDSEVLKALLEPIRLGIIRVLRRQNLSAKQLGKALDESPKNLYYHLNELEKHDLIEVATTNQKGNLVEKIYRTKYSYFTIAPELLSLGSETNNLFYNTIATTQTTVLADLRKALSHPDFFKKKMFDTYQTIRMTPERWDEFINKLSDLIKTYFDNSSDEGNIDVYISALCFGAPVKPVDSDGSQESNPDENL